jgi:hypothetical protein
MRLVSRCVPFLAALLLSAQPALADVTAKLRVTTDGQAMNATWFQGAKGVRIETDTPMGKTVVIADAKNRAYVLFVATRTYLEPAGEERPPETDLAACVGAGADACLAQKGFRKGGAETVNGVACDVWQRTEGEGDAVTGIKLWKPRQGPMPFARVEYGGAPGMTTRVDVLSAKEGPVDAALFVLPAGYKKQALPSVPGFAPGQGGKMPTKAEIEAMIKQFGGPDAAKMLQLPVGTVEE